MPLHRLHFTFLLAAFLLCGTIEAATNGDTVTLGGRRFKLLSNNIISNPGFENGFTSWTDATTTGATLTSANYSIVASGGVDNSKYLIGLTNSNSSSAGSIGTGWPISSGKTYLFAYQVKYLSNTAAAANQTYLKVSLTNNKLSSDEPKVVLNGSQVDGGGVWTRNFVYFTNTNPSYTYAVARFRWLNNQFGFDDFMLFEATEVANTSGLQELITTAQSLYQADAVGASELQTAITTAQGQLSSNSATTVEAAITSLQKAINAYRYANATPANPVDMTSFLSNPGFDDNSTYGWEGAGTVNYHEVEFYEKTFNMHQSVVGLPAGKYRLTAKGFERPKSNDAGAAFKAGSEILYARLYASATNFADVSVPFNSIYKHNFYGSGAVNGYVNTMAGAETLFNNTTASYYDLSLNTILLDEGGTLTVGAKTDFKQTGYWVLFDRFKLYYLGKADVSDWASAVSNRMAEAGQLLTQRLQDTAAVSLNRAIALGQLAISANPLVEADVLAARKALDGAVDSAKTSINAYAALFKALTGANQILTFLDKDTEITTLQNAIASAQASLENSKLTLAQINTATSSLKTVTASVGKKIYVPTWMMGDVYNPSNNWSIERSKQSKNWILFWEPGFGDYPGTIVDDCLALAEKCFDFYTDSLKFITRGRSKTDIYKMIIRLRYTDEWEATGSGVDNTIGLLTLTSWALSSRGGQTVAHEVGHCFQYQTHCDNNNQNGWMYGYGANASGSNGWWEQCAQWQAYKIFPAQQFTGEWMSGYLANTHKNLLDETYRYNNYFIQDYWCYRHGMGQIGLLWNKSVKPEDPVEAYKRLNSVTQSAFNDEMWDCAARFATWDIPALKSYGASAIASRPQPKLKNTGNYIWRIDSTVCLENYGHNIIRLNAPTTAKTVTVRLEGLAGTNGFRKNYVSYAGWRYGLVALLTNGTRVYSEARPVSMSAKGGKDTLNFECPANCNKLWLVVSGAPSTHWRHAWDDNYLADEQWPYQVSFNNTNLYGYANVVGLDNEPVMDNLDVFTSKQALFVRGLNDATIRIFDTTGRCLKVLKSTSDECSATLPSGVYVVVVQQANGVSRRKVLIP